MLRYCVIFFTIIWIAASCKMSNKNVKKHLLAEDPLPKDILEIYLTKASLGNIEKGVDSFEVRKWYPFYYTDSFPVALERFYYHNGKFQGEYYLFSNKEGRILMTKKELLGLQVEKYVINDIPSKFLDSLQFNYNLANIDSFDINLVRNESISRMSTRTNRNVFFEQSSSTDYYGVFITEPGLYPALHPSLDMYASFSKFTFDSLCQRDTGFNKWFDEKARRIEGLK